MMESSEAHISGSSPDKLEQYYRFHSRIYDATRWTFLFGREPLLNRLPALPPQPRIMEIGCGTGHNIERLGEHFPDARILGVDLSEEMLEVAQQKLEERPQVKLCQASYGGQSLDEDPFDLILLSYSLTMIGDQVQDVLEQISRDLASNGHIAVVDFHTSPFGWFRRWMEINHVDLSGHLLPLLKENFQPVESEIKPAYLGLWSYFLFIGR